MAGQSSTGRVAASMMVVSKSSPMPPATLPIKLAVAGATTMASTSWPRATCSKGSLSGPNMAVATFSPVRAANVNGPTNSWADRVITTLTRAPQPMNRRASSAAL